MPAGLPAQGTVQQEFVEHLKFDNPGARAAVQVGPVVPDFLTALIGNRSGIGLATAWATPIRTGIQQSFYQEVSTSTATAAGSLTDGSRTGGNAWATNEWANRYVVSITAAGALTFALVASNTATVLTISGAWSNGTPNSGSVYYITVAIQRTAGTLTTRDNYNPAIIRQDGNTEAA